jgi:general secretion pathway protein N
VIKALENNTIGMVLASACGVFALICLGLVVLWVLPPSAGSGEAESGETEAPGSIAALQEAKPLEEYAVVSERPVFNEDRRPAPVLDDGEFVDELPMDDVEAPDVELAGVIITPTLRMATLRSKEHEQSLVAFEGKPLEGNFGTWQVSKIEERMVTLASADGEEMQLELQVHQATIREPPKPARQSEQPQSVEEQAAELLEDAERQAGEPMSRAEEIRQRIEERREELRRAAEERDGQQAENYRDAIQSMIQRRQEERSQQQEAEQDGQ